MLLGHGREKVLGKVSKEIIWYYTFRYRINNSKSFFDSDNAVKSITVKKAVKFINK